MGKKPCIVTDMDHCMICGKPYPEHHHIYFGTANRKQSDKYGYIVPLCSEHHREGKYSAHRNRELDLMLKRQAQALFEEDHTRQEFIQTFGRSYR